MKYIYALPAMLFVKNALENVNLAQKFFVKNVYLENVSYVINLFVKIVTLGVVLVGN
jgi:hypothetical protein